MTKDELRGKLLNLTEEHFGCVLDDMADEILSLLAPELEKAEKWDKIVRIADYENKARCDASCDGCPLDSIIFCGTVCRYMKGIIDVLEGGKSENKS
jgi:hypothetical protein